MKRGREGKSAVINKRKIESENERAGTCRRLMGTSNKEEEEEESSNFGNEDITTIIIITTITAIISRGHNKVLAPPSSELLMGKVISAAISVMIYR